MTGRVYLGALMLMLLLVSSTLSVGAQDARCEALIEPFLLDALDYDTPVALIAFLGTLDDAQLDALGETTGLYDALEACEATGFVSVALTNALVRADVHDPAQLVRTGDNALLLAASAVEWQTYDPRTDTWTFLGGDLYDGDTPAWDTGDGQFWAPGVVRVDDDTFRLYHSAVYDEDRHGSRIGFVTSIGTGDAIGWFGEDDFVVESASLDEPFAIDPAPFVDDAGRHWLVYGSHGDGIVIVELDPQTGYLLARPGDKRADDRFVHLADYGGALGDENHVEAAFVYNHPDEPYYYLFVNWDRCCNRLDSTYNIRVGRATEPTGPYLDRDGRDMADGGGTLFLDATGDQLGDARFHGPGHAGVYRHTDGLDYFSHHFYDRLSDGAPSWALWQLDWVDGWPVIDTAHAVDLSPGQR